MLFIHILFYCWQHTQFKIPRNIYHRSTSTHLMEVQIQTARQRGQHCNPESISHDDVITSAAEWLLWLCARHQIALWWLGLCMHKCSMDIIYHYIVHRHIICLWYCICKTIMIMTFWKQFALLKGNNFRLDTLCVKWLGRVGKAGKNINIVYNFDLSNNKSCTWISDSIILSYLIDLLM